MNKEGSFQKYLSDIEICRAKWVVAGKVSECIEMPQKGCRYSVSFGNSYFCLHPMREEIVRKTYQIDEKS